MYVCVQHDTAENLSVCSVDVGLTEPRTVVCPAALVISSSLNDDDTGVADDDVADAGDTGLCVVLCNVKPTAVRGVHSHALILTAYLRSHTHTHTFTYSLSILTAIFQVKLG